MARRMDIIRGALSIALGWVMEWAGWLCNDEHMQQAGLEEKLRGRRLKEFGWAHERVEEVVRALQQRRLAWRLERDRDEDQKRPAA